MDKLLSVNNLSVSFKSYAGIVKAVRNVSFDVNKSEILAMVGESGCGKTVTAKAIMRLHERSGGIIDSGSSIIFEDKNILEMPKKDLSTLRGGSISMIFQDSMTSLNPTMTVGKQICECIRLHTSQSKAECMKRAEELLELVEIPGSRERLKCYPHQLSGGMRQRVMIAMALSCNPKLLIADEPTTALDVTIQAQLLDLLHSLKEKLNMSVIIVTHDLGVVADFADKIQVMYAGNIVERGTTKEIFTDPRHPYTLALMKSIPGNAMHRKAELYSIKGTPPDLIMPLDYCPFSARCEYCMPICKKALPQSLQINNTHSVSCWLTHPLAAQNYLDLQNSITMRNNPVQQDSIGQNTQSTARDKEGYNE